MVISFYASLLLLLICFGAFSFYPAFYIRSKLVQLRNSLAVLDDEKINNELDIPDQITQDILPKLKTLKKDFNQEVTRQNIKLHKTIERLTAWSFHLNL